MFVKYYTELRKLMHKRNPKLPTNMLLFFYLLFINQQESANRAPQPLSVINMKSFPTVSLI